MQMAERHAASSSAGNGTNEACRLPLVRFAWSDGVSGLPEGRATLQGLPRRSRGLSILRPKRTVAPGTAGPSAKRSTTAAAADGCSMGPSSTVATSSIACPLSATVLELFLHTRALWNHSFQYFSQREQLEFLADLALDSEDTVRDAVILEQWKAVRAAGRAKAFTKAVHVQDALSEGCKASSLFPRPLVQFKCFTTHRPKTSGAQSEGQDPQHQREWAIKVVALSFSWAPYAGLACGLAKWLPEARILKHCQRAVGRLGGQAVQRCTCALERMGHVGRVEPGAFLSHRSTRIYGLLPQGGY